MTSVVNNMFSATYSIFEIQIRVERYITRIIYEILVGVPYVQISNTNQFRQVLLPSSRLYLHHTSHPHILLVYPTLAFSIILKTVVLKKHPIDTYYTMLKLSFHFVLHIYQLKWFTFYTRIYP